MVQSEVMREATLPLSALKDGDHFRLELHTYDDQRKRLVHVGWTYGTRMHGNDCRVRVRMLGNQTQVTFDEASGKVRSFQSNGTTEMNYPTMLEVVRVDDNAYEATETLGSDRRSTMDAAQEKAIRARYNFAKGSLAKAVEAKDAGKVEVAQKRYDGIVAEAEAAGVNLETAAPAKPAAAAAKGKPAPAVKAQDAAAVKALTQKAKGEKASKKEKALPSTSNCLCGCGGETGGRFRPGHDARVKGVLIQCERGLIDADTLPESLKPYVAFKGKKATAGKENSDYRLAKAPVRFPGRPDIAFA